MQELASRTTRRLEIAPGLRPRLPLEGTQFVDISQPALRQLHGRGSRVANGTASALPFADASFDFVCAFDIVEHVVDDEGVLAELSRVAEPGAWLLLSVPLDPGAWNAFDDFVGHYRRYEPEAITAKLAAGGFIIEHSAIYGMQPKSSTHPRHRPVVSHAQARTRDVVVQPRLHAARPALPDARWRSARA